MEIKLEGTGLSVKGSCLIKDLDPLLKSLQDMINSDRKSIHLDLKGVEAIDTAGIQLIASCRQSALELGKTFKIISESDVVRDTIQLVGLENIFKD